MAVIIKPDFMRPEKIEREANHLLDSYFSSKGKPLELPIPVEDILESYLKLNLEIIDMPDAGILGYYDAFNNTIAINAQIAPESLYNGASGRFNFTMAHEIGHHCLHRGLIIANSNQLNLNLQDEPIQPTRIVCRKSDNNQPIEIQANLFASALLMPQAALKDEWQKAWQVCCDETEEFSDHDIRVLLCNKFQVSWTAMELRLKKMGISLESHGSQRVLL